MKVLFTLYDLQNYGGTETFTYTLGKQLIAMGNEVFCFSTKLGMIAEKFKEAGIVVVDDLRELPKDIDIIHGQHNVEASFAQNFYPKIPIIFVCHGIYPWQEQPIKIPAIYQYVAISEEVQQ